MDRNTWIALALIGLVIIMTPYWEGWFNPKPAPEPVTQQTRTDTVVVKKDSTIGKIGAVTRTDSIATAKPLSEAIAWQSRKSDESKGVTRIETPLYSAVLAWDGARFVSWKLKPNGKYIKEPTELARNQGFAIIPGAFFRDGGIRTVDHLVFSSSDTVINIGPGETKPVVLKAQFDQIGPVEVIYQFKGNDFTFDITARFVSSNPAWQGETGVWTMSPGLNPTEDLRVSSTGKFINVGEDYYIGSHTWLGEVSKGMHEEFSPKADKIDKFEATGTTQWVAQRSKYFVAALQPLKPANSVIMQSDIGPEKTWKTQRIQLQVSPTGGNGVFAARVYLGPLKDDMVTAFAPDLSSIMNWGWIIIKPFSIATLWLLAFLYKIVPNYGLVILIFTIIIKLVLWPLTVKQFRSMKEMQIVQPLLAEMREKYKDNPKKQQEEMFRIYGEYRINPAAGCLPMVLQMPVLYSLFIVFRSTIELRDAPFLFWIKDLSQPEALMYLPFNIPLYGQNVALLPILMGVTQFFMSKQTATNDPNQKIMLYMMPVMMSVFFNSLPAGLVLYYTFYNLTTIIQQHYIKGTTDKKVPEVAVIKS